MPRARLTKKTVDAVRPGERDQFFWDDDVAGFGLKVTPAGGKVYIFQYRLAPPGEAQRTAAKRYTIGKHGTFTPEQARKRARELAGLVAHGTDPRASEVAQLNARRNAERSAAERARLDGELSFENVAALWLDHYENEMGRRPSSVRQAKLVVNRHLKPQLSGKPMPHIDRAHLQPILDAIPLKQRGMRRAVFAYASVLFGWAAKRGDIPSNPLSDMAKPAAPKARDRVLSDKEMKELWEGTGALLLPFQMFFRLLMLTGQRRSEVAQMEWGELDRAAMVWTVPAARAKNGVAHLVPLSPLVIASLDRLAVAAGEKEADDQTWPAEGFVLSTGKGARPISGITKAKNALDAAAPQAIDHWRIHDLRRTLATGFQRLGVRFEVTEAVLNQVSGAKSGIAGVYQRHDWKDEKRSALVAWEGHVSSLTSGEVR